jgi:hypothetical protein
MKFKTVFLVFVIAIIWIVKVNAQQYNLVKLLNNNRLDTSAANEAYTLNNESWQAISARGMIWLKGVSFTNGTIDIDLRGKDVFMQSFLGVAFHAKDTLNYELVYFRPFRFHSTDTPTRKWAVQYMSMPGCDYDKLRKEHPGVYENAADPAPDANEWFHATIVVKGKWITVYINHSAMASLRVRKLNNISTGKIGLWTSVSSGDFANLKISKQL